MFLTGNSHERHLIMYYLLTYPQAYRNHLFLFKLNLIFPSVVIIVFKPLQLPSFHTKRACYRASPFRVSSSSTAGTCNHYSAVSGPSLSAWIRADKSSRPLYLLTTFGAEKYQQTFVGSNPTFVFEENTNGFGTS